MTKAQMTCDLGHLDARIGRGSRKRLGIVLLLKKNSQQHITSKNRFRAGDTLDRYKSYQITPDIR